MATARDQAVRDFREKLRLERELAPKLVNLNKKIVREFIRHLALTGNVTNAEAFDRELRDILKDHYEKVGASFDDQIKLTGDTAKTEEEQTLIDNALLLYYFTRAEEQTTIINNTTQGNMDDSAAFGNDERARQAEEGQPISAVEAAVLSGVALSRKLRGRVESIALTETQAVAETAKATEVSVLLGQQPDIIATTPRESGAEKEWVTFGDEVVRPAHKDADGQIVDASEPFVVGGQLLMRPGDTSLGATLDNIIGCRCSAVYSSETIDRFRRTG